MLQLVLMTCVLTNYMMLVHSAFSHLCSVPSFGDVGMSHEYVDVQSETVAETYL